MQANASKMKAMSAIISPQHSVDFPQYFMGSHSTKFKGREKWRKSGGCKESSPTAALVLNRLLQGPVSTPDVADAFLAPQQGVT